MARAWPTACPAILEAILPKLGVRTLKAVGDRITAAQTMQ
jgi:hypothetical protein